MGCKDFPHMSTPEKASLFEMLQRVTQNFEHEDIKRYAKYLPFYTLSHMSIKGIYHLIRP